MAAFIPFVFQDLKAQRPQDLLEELRVSEDRRKALEDRGKALEHQRRELQERVAFLEGMVGPSKVGFTD